VLQHLPHAFPGATNRVCCVRKSALPLRLLPSLIVGEILILPLLIGAATIFYVAIERPCMDKNWPKKLGAWLSARVSKEASVVAAEASYWG
jgi:peptidoglycan/LPS O-acetylase OafA/YrhL